MIGMLRPQILGVLGALRAQDLDLLPGARVFQLGAVGHPRDRRAWRLSGRSPSGERR